MKRILVVIILIFIFFVTGCSSKGESMSYSGRVEATKVDICSEVGGTIERIHVSEGDKVNPEQLLVEIDNEQAFLNLKKAETAVEAARAKLQDAVSGSRIQEIEKARENIEVLESELKQAEKEVQYFKSIEERQRRLYEEGAISKQSYDDASLNLERAESGLEVVRHKLAQAKLQLQLLEEGNTEQYLKVLESQLQQAKLSKEQAELNYKEHMIYSPAAGTVETVNYEEGETIKPGSCLVSLINLEEQWINIYVPQGALGKWKLGDRVTIEADAYPGEKFTGEVIFISSQAEFTPKNVQTKEARMDTVFKIKIKLLEGRDRLRPGMWAEVIRGEDNV